MSRAIPLRCRCGAVRGVAREVAPSTVNRGLCFCHDCRAFAHWLGRADVMDARGGTEIIQMARGRLDISDGRQHLRCLRLAPKGLHRWYADCCKTPLGNTMPAIPFVGLAVGALEVPVEQRDATFGRVVAINAAAAIGGARPDERLSLRDLVRVIGLFAGWLLRRRGHPTPFFDARNRPMVKPRVLTPAERQALREHPRA